MHMVVMTSTLAHVSNFEATHLFEHFEFDCSYIPKQNKSIVVSEHLVLNQDFCADFFVLNECIQFCVQHY